MKLLRNIIFTWNNPDEDHHSLLKEWVGTGYCKYQLEQGESGTKHLQGYIELSKRTAFSTVAKKFPWHVEARRGTQTQAIEYCSKEDTRLEGPWTFGEPKKQGKRNDIEQVYEAIRSGKRKRDVCEEFPLLDVKFHRGFDRYRTLVEKDERQDQRELDVHVYYGKSGSGKTRKAYEENPVMYALTFGGSQTWFDGYEGEQCLLIDEFYGQMPWNELLRILDRYPLRLAVKGGFTYAAWTKVIITSNKSPQEWYSCHEPTPLLRRINKTLFMF